MEEEEEENQMEDVEEKTQEGGKDEGEILFYGTNDENTPLI